MIVLSLNYIDNKNYIMLKREHENFNKAIGLTFGTSIAYIDADDIESQIQKAAEALKAKGIDVRRGVFKGGSFRLSKDFEIENPKEFEKYIFEARYGERVRALASKLNNEWRDKFYKV